MSSGAHNRRSGLPSLELVALCVAIALLVTLPAVRLARAEGPADAWEMARRAGSYHFSADIQQTVTAQPTILNVGRESKQDRFLLEGEANLPERLLRLTLWSQGGSLLDAGTGVEVRIEDERAYGRQAGGDWEEIPNFAGVFAPDGDFLAFLAAARDIVDLGPQTRAGVAYNLYTFQIDGPRYAAFVRDQMKASLSGKDGLPAGAELELPKEYAGMTGDGELWVGTDGLPLRQVLHVQFAPDEQGSRSTAEVTVDFSGYGSIAPAAGDLAPATRSGAAGALSALGLLGRSLPAALCMALVVCLVVVRRSRRLYRIVVIVVICSMVLIPLLQADRAHAFSQHQQADAARQEAMQTESEAIQEAQVAAATSPWDPNVDPLAAWKGAALAAQTPAVYGPFLPNAGVLDSGGGGEEDEPDCDMDDAADDDGDGLTNGAECALGTHPDMEDTDSDDVKDNVEVTGFSYNGKTWYGNPLEQDTNKDALSDGREWNLDENGDGEPDDTDADGTPDPFDLDNDGDDVPDEKDLSPYYKGSTVYSDDAPFELVLDSLEEGRPTFVQFQLRPTDPDRLWYAFNVLDWPDGDREGQIQDADGKTFYDVDDTLSPSPNDNGDVKLVPMLEIQTAGDPDNLPPSQECADDGESYTCWPDLEHYGISVRELNDAGDLAIYVPLNLVTANPGSERVAFQGKMLYHAAASWGNAQQVRLVWAVQALVDVCDEYQDGQCSVYSQYNDVQILHAYYDDDWTLTGLAVREDHGSETATIYEDPAIDNNLQKEEPLVRLMYGLNHTFLAGSDCEEWDDNGTPDDYSDDTCVSGNNERDVTVDTIRDRWNWSTNNGVPLDPDRWSIEPDILAVQRGSFGTQDEAVANLVMTTTVGILDDHFTEHWSAAEPISPTIMFAREDTSRSTTLDAALDDDSGVVSWSEAGRRLTMNLAPDEVEEQVVASLNWAPFLYDDEEERWEAYPIDEYWDLLGQRAEGELSDESDPEVRGGKVGIAQLLYLTVFQGMSNVVEVNGDVSTKPYQTYDRPLGATIATLSAKVIVFIVNQLFLKAFWNASTVSRAVFQLLKSQRFAKSGLTAAGGIFANYIKPAVREWFRALRPGNVDYVYRLAVIGMYTCILLVGLVVAVVVLAVLAARGNNGARIALAVIVAVVMAAVTVIMPILLVLDAIAAFKGLMGLSTLGATLRVLSSGTELAGTSLKAGAIGLIIAVAISWGIFLYVWLSGKVKAGSIAFDVVLAQTIAACLFALAMFAISVTVIGLILTSIFSVVDVFLSLLGIGFTLSGWLIEVWSQVLYSYDVAVEIDSDMGALDMSLVQPSLGFVDGSELQFSTTVTTTVRHSTPSEMNGAKATEYFDEEQLRRTQINYVFYSPYVQHPQWSTGNDWRDVHVVGHNRFGTDMYEGWKADDVATDGVFLRTGVNGRYPLPLYFRARFSLPAVSCWLVIFVPVCSDKEVDGMTDPNLMAQILKFDVLPTTLDEFLDVEWAQGMLWRDVDNDGLMAVGYGGSDPDDGKWDTDGDGLSDGWEVEVSARPADEGGYLFDPTRADTDGDGLADRDEALAGCNPSNADSDGDTLSDVTEVVDGWQFTFWQGRSIVVHSSPLDPDADSDGMDDAFEKTLHTCPGCDPLENRYNPNVWNASPVGLSTELGLDTAVIGPGQSFVYTTTVQNNLNPDLWVRGDTELDAGPIGGGPQEMAFDLPRGASQALYSDLVVPAGTGTQDVDLHTDLDAQLHTPSVWAWDPEQSGNATTASGNQVDGVAVSPVNGWTTPYVVAALETSAAVDRVYAYAATASGIVGSGVHIVGWAQDVSNAPPDIACNDAGKCLVVWANNDPSSGNHYFRRRIVEPTLQVPNSHVTISAPSGQQTYGGRAASDGSGYLMVWMMGTDASRTLYAQAVDASNQTVGSRLTLDAGLVADADVTWAFDHYLVVWSENGELNAASIQGSALTGTWAVCNPADCGTVGEVRLAYDPAGQRSLAAYRSVEDGDASLRGRILNREEVGDELSLADLGNPASGLSLAVSPDPMNGGWVVAYLEKMSQARIVQGVAMDGSLRGDPANPGGILDLWTWQDLACAQPRPDLRLLFDESSGATTFADDSGFDHDGTCSGSTCPTSGVGGKDGNAVTFDGSDDYVTDSVDVSEVSYGVTLWFKTTCQSCGLFQVGNAAPGSGDHDRHLYLNKGNVCTRTWSNETICSTGLNVADGNWHFLAHTFGGSVGGQKLYVDGVLKASGTKAKSDFNWQDRVIVGYSKDATTKYLAGTLDEVTVYPRALTEGEVRDRYRSALAVYALDEAAGSTNFQNSAHNGYTASCSGAACPTAGETGMAYAAARFDGTSDCLTVANESRTVSESFYDFQSSAGNGWSDTTISTAPAGQKFLGQFGNSEITLSLTDLPAHDQVQIEYDVYVIKTWDGNKTGVGPDYWEWSIDGTQQLKTTFVNYDPPYNYQAYPGAVTSPSSVKITGKDDDFLNPQTRTWTFTADTASYATPNCKELQSVTIDANAAATFYERTNYGGSSKSCDGKAGTCPANGSKRPVKSVRLWATGNNWKQTGGTYNTLGYSPDAIYHVTKTLDHGSASIQIKFKGSNLEALDNESWGLDNVRVKAVSRNVPLANSSLTVSFWAKRDDINRWDVAVGQGTGATNVGLHLGFRPGNAFTCGFWGNDLDSPAYTDTDWHHWACTYDASSNLRTIYRDGVQVAQATASADYQGSGTLWIGQAPWGSARFKGLLDEVGVWNTALSASEVERLYQKVKVVDDSLTECAQPRGLDGVSSLYVDRQGLRETTTTLGTATREAEDTVTVDATAPASSITSLTSGHYLPVTRTLVIGGEASDNTFIGSIAVSCDNGPWDGADGAETWSYGWDTSALGEGAHTLRSRATDIVGNNEAPASITVILDRTPPQVTLDTPPQRAVAGLDSNWEVELGGTVADPAAGGSPGSGVKSVEVLLLGEDKVAGNGWQAATVDTGGAWSIRYRLPDFSNDEEAMRAYTGRYTVSLRPADNVGNASVQVFAAPQVALDHTAPKAEMVVPDAADTDVLTVTGMLLTGVISDSGAVAYGVDSAQIAFRPAEQADLYVGAVLYLKGDDPAMGPNPVDHAVFEDSSGFSNHARCDSYGGCPTVSADGRLGGAMDLDGHPSEPDDLTVDADESLNLGAGDGEFTLAAWMLPRHGEWSDATFGVMGAKYDGGGRAPWMELYHVSSYSDLFRVQAGFTDSGGTAWTVQSGADYPLRFWVHASATFDGENLTLYVNGAQVAQTAVPAGTRPKSQAVAYKVGYPFPEDYGYAGLLDEVLVETRALSPLQARALYDSASLQWSAADLAASGTGVLTTTWTYTLPGGLEAYYELPVRGTDAAGNRNDRTVEQSVWSGEIDTKAPGGAIQWNGVGSWWNMQTWYLCDVSDMNLDESTYTGCRCPTATWQRTYYHEVSDWYRETTTDTQRLYRIYAECTVNEPWPGCATSTVCDRHGHCTTVQDCHKQTEGSPEAGLLYSSVLTPTIGEVLGAVPISVLGVAHADSYLKTLTVTANGTPFYTMAWPAPPAPGAAKDYNWSTALTPPGEGQVVLVSSVTDWANTVQPQTQPVTVTADLLPPAPPVLDTPVITAAHSAYLGAAILNGSAADSMGVEKVEVDTGRGWREATLSGSLTNPDWRGLWFFDLPEPDGETMNVAMRATDLGGHVTPVTAPVLVDLVAPATVTVTLGYWDLSGSHHAIQPGETVRDGNLLTIDWTPSSDGSGVAGYWVGWTDSPTRTMGTVFVPEGTVYSISLPVAEATAVYAHVVPVDLTGNRQEQALGPVYVDAPVTPDVVGLATPAYGGGLYHGWLESGCSELGLSRRIPDYAQTYASLDEEQKLYASWDEGGLRLGWTGANWNSEGDLFLYLDTKPGGATQAFDPYGTGTVIYLPGNVPPVDTGDWPAFEVARSSQAWAGLSTQAMQADYAVWVEDASTATLLAWNGSAWAAERLLSAAEFALAYGRVGAAAPTHITDLYLPFEALDIANPAMAQLSLLAVASQEEALHLWTALPELNLVDAAEAVNSLAAAAGSQEYMLTTAYRWLSLGPGLCPYLLAWPQLLNGAGFLDRDLRAELSAAPGGTAYSLVGDDLAWQWAQLFLEPGPKSEGFTFMDNSHRPLGQGQAVTYTLRVSNHGAAPAEDVKALVSAYYALTLPGGTPDPTGYRDWQVVEVRDVGAGETVTVTFTGVVEVESNPRYERCLTVDGLPPEVCRLLLESAVADALLFDSRLPLDTGLPIPVGLPLEWMWTDHQVDLDPPEAYGILEPGATVRSGATTVRGYATDPSGVPLVEVEVRDAGGGSSYLSCPDGLPDDGLWSCDWMAVGNDGDEIDLRVRASDGLGHVSDWSAPWRTTVLDTTPPTVTLGDEARAGVEGLVIGRDGALLDGEVGDLHGMAHVEICHVLPEGTTCEAATTLIATAAPTATATLYDDVPPSPLPINAGTTCGGGEIVRTFSVAESFVVGDVDLGFSATHLAREEMVVELISPAGTRARVIAPDGSTYGFENYDVWLNDAAAGKLHVPVDDDVAGPYFDRAARPEAPLAAFAGEVSAGEWALMICDLNPALNEGAYNRARLSLTPQTSAVSTAGTWTYRLRPAPGADGLAQTLAIYAGDDAGNRTDGSIGMSFIGDAVAPELAVTLQVPQTQELAPEPVLAGSVGDGETVAAVTVRVMPAEGAEYYEGASLSGMLWSYTPANPSPGIYSLWVEARDRAGNAAALGPYVLEVLPGPYPCHARVESSGQVFASADASAVQDAVDAAVEGETVKIAGTCAGTQEREGLAQTVYLSQTLTLAGGYTAENWSVADPEANPTTLDAGGRGRVLYVAGAIAPTIDGLRLTGGDASGQGGGLSGYDAGGGVYIISATATISNCVVDDNVASQVGPGEGGGIYLRSGGGTIQATRVVSNTASRGDRGWGGGVYVSESSVQVLAAELEQNLAGAAGEGRGGGLYAFGGTLTLAGSRAALNTASTAGTGYGGGLTLYGVEATLTSNVIEQNSASTSGEGHGGGLYLQAGHVELEGNWVQDNTAAAGGGAGYGGGLALWVTAVTLSGEHVLGNSASIGGDGYGGGLYAAASSPVVSGTLVLSNTATLSDTAAGLGGGLLISDTWPLILTNNFLAANGANTQGGDLWLANTGVSTQTITLLHNTFAGPVACSSELGTRNSDRAERHPELETQNSKLVTSGLYLGSWVTATLTNTILAGYGGAGLYVGSGSSVRLAATLWHENAQDVTGPGTVVREDDVYGDPAFVDAAGWDYHLGAGSAAVDRGADAGVPIDIDGEARPFGLAPDIGADELLSDEAPITGLIATNDSPTELGMVTALTATVDTGTSVSYTWAFGDGEAGSGDVVSHTYPAVGSYTAVVTAENTYNVLTATTAVTVTDLPVDGLVATNDSPTLLGSATALTATVTAGTGVSYTWAYGDGVLGSGEVVSHVYPAAGSYTAVVTASNTANVLTATTPVTVEAPIPPGSVGLTGRTEGYVERPVRFTARVTPPEATLPITYLWEAMGQAPVTHVAGLSDEVSYTWSLTGTQQVTVTVANGAGVVSSTLGITVLPQEAHVHDIALTYRERYPGMYNVQSAVRMLSQANKPVGSASVEVEWILPNGKHIPQSAHTNLSGLSRLQISRQMTGVYQICVTAVTKSGWEYDPEANVETCDTIGVPGGQEAPESPGVALEGPQEAGVGDAGSVISYTLWLTNEGRGTDQFLVETSGNEWPVSLSLDDTGPLEAGASVEVTVVVTVPLEVALLEAWEDTCVVTATSIWEDAVTDTIVLVTEWESPRALAPAGPRSGRRPS